MINEELENLVYRMLSYLDTIIVGENHCIEKGEHLLMKEFFIRDFNNILKLKEEKKENIIPKVHEPEQILNDEVKNIDNMQNENKHTYINNISIKHEDDINIKPYQNINEEQHVQFRGKDIYYENIQDLSTKLNIPINQAKKIINDNTKPENNIEEQKLNIVKKIKGLDNILKGGNANNTIDKKKEKIKVRLGAMWAEQVRDIGKELGIKPEKGKNLSKTYITNIILNNSKLYDKVLDAIYNSESNNISNK